MKWISKWQNKIRSSTELCRDYRKRAGLWRQFALEAIPIMRYALQASDYIPKATIFLHSGNQPFDAKVTYQSVSYFIEVTSTESVVAAYKREYLNKHPFVAGDPVGVQTKADLKRARSQGFPPNVGQFLYGTSGQEAELQLILERTRAKMARTHYPPETILIVNSVDRILDLWNEEKIIGWLRQRLATEPPTPFSQVWLTLEDGRAILFLGDLYANPSRRM